MEKTAQRIGSEMAEKEGAKPKILFVDDEENVLRSLSRLLMDEDIEVLTASSGADGLDKAKQNRDIAVVVSDQRMPGMSGWEFLEKVGAVAPEAVRIILTGYADVSAAINAINRGGAYRYITKPWNDADMILMLKDAVDKNRLVAENRFLTELTRKQNEELRQWGSQLEMMVQEQTLDIQKKNDRLQQLNSDLQNTFKGFVEAMSSLIEIRDKSVSSHSRGVAALARQTAVAMSLSGEEVSDIFVAALLHDIGKIGIPDAILARDATELHGFELKIYESHSIRGQVAVERAGLKEVGLLIRHHHERLNGSGFPDGLKRGDIPLGSRIIGLADAIDRIAQRCRTRGAVDPLNVAAAVEETLDISYDRQVYGRMGSFIAERLKNEERAGKGSGVKVPPEKLEAGMVLAQDVLSGTGMLLLARGMVLDKASVIGLQRLYRIDPFTKDISIARK